MESFTITTYDYHIYIVQATGVPLISLSEQCRQLACLAYIGFFCIITASHVKRTSLLRLNPNKNYSHEIF